MLRINWLTAYLSISLAWAQATGWGILDSQILEWRAPMPIESHDIPKVMRIHLRITQYPILANTIRERMRQEIFRRGIISRERFEQEARDKAILSQKREGITNPYVEEPAEIWERRLGQIRDYLTDFYFAYNLPPQRFDEIVRDVLVQRTQKEEILTYNPELAPWDVLFGQAEEYEALPADQQARVRHHLQEIKVVLIKAMISEQLAFVRVAKEYLTVQDLKWIRYRRVGQGKIGGKSAGLILAWKILQQTFAQQREGSPLSQIVLPQSYFIGADVFYEFLALNNLSDFMNQKYKTLSQIEEEYPALREAYAHGVFPEYVTARLREVLDEVQGEPLIVRSSSLLEDNFETSFAGKYESVFCPNQGSPEENLAELTNAIARVYSSVANPDALLYRRQKGLLDFDERMAVLIQVVQGERYRDFFFPTVAGMAYSRNPFIWSPQLRREDGFLRMVIGLGTRAVERVGEDYPRMVALSHPRLRPEAGAQQIRYYSQYYMDVLNLSQNRLETRRVHEVIGGDLGGLRLLAALDNGEDIVPMRYNDPAVDPRKLVMTFDGLLGQTTFVDQLKKVLKALEFGYGRPVDIEFTVGIGREYPKPGIRLHLLQCRPQSGHEVAEDVRFPAQLAEADIVFGAGKLVPTGRVRNIAQIVYVNPDAYMQADISLKLELARLVGRLNQRLEGQIFILMGPGRWGSSNTDLGLKVTYADIYNARAIIEMGWETGKNRPTLSYGTHFFQDLVESHIFPLAIFPGEAGNPFQQEFFDKALNALPVLLPDAANHADCIKVIDVPATTGGRVLELIMSGEEGRAVAFLTRPSN